MKRLCLPFPSETGEKKQGKPCKDKSMNESYREECGGSPANGYRFLGKTGILGDRIASFKEGFLERSRVKKTDALRIAKDSGRFLGHGSLLEKI